MKFDELSTNRFSQLEDSSLFVSELVFNSKKFQVPEIVVSEIFHCKTRPDLERSVTVTLLGELGELGWSIRMLSR